MCGIIGIVAKSPVNQAIYDGLTVLQHRGQDAAGMVTCDGNKLYLRKDNGLVRDVFHTRHMLNLKGNMGIGHVRYPTAGCSSSAEAQPFYVNTPYGITLAHNGNLTNAETLKEDLMRDDLRHLNTNSDSEVLLNILAHELSAIGKLRKNLKPEDIFKAVNRLHKRCKGGYAAVAMITEVGILGFRDPNGIRPVVFGERKTESGSEFIIASESVAIDALDFKRIRDIEPGEAVFITLEGEIYTFQCSDNPTYSPCIFEHVYLARPDSIIDGISVYKARLRMGDKLAMGVKYREGFVKNRYIPRTFIMPGQSIRKKSVRQKLNAIGLEFKGKNVLLVDDSIVRGTTSREIVQMAREAGAKRVYVASAAPPVRYPNVYGIDMPTAAELIAYNKTVEEVAETIGADWLVYQDIKDLIASAHRGNKKITKFDTSCFTGEYVTGDVSTDYLARIETIRNDSARDMQNSDEGLTDLTENY
jgi:amidophosphoribosyltransferase